MAQEQQVPTQNETEELTETESTAEENTENSQEPAENAEVPVEEKETEAEPELVEEEAPREPDWKDRYIRLAADFDNYRKRTATEHEDVRKRERERVLEAWLDVYDNAERALSSMKEKEGPWFDGFKAIITQMDRVLSKFSIKPMDAMGKKFDPKYHEAIATIPNPALENGSIMHVEKRGFVYENGNVMRVARVVVVKNS